jgi:hypothetical protein
MKLKLSLMMISSVGLASGCVTPRECVWTDTILFENESVVDWLVSNDPDLLVGVTSHNEKRAEFCP